MTNDINSLFYSATTYIRMARAVNNDAPLARRVLEFAAEKIDAAATLQAISGSDFQRFRLKLVRTDYDLAMQEAA
jgi:Na+-translocating ferredoxin:NAD+ oxidoreductase RnfC subunit